MKWNNINYTVVYPLYNCWNFISFQNFFTLVYQGDSQSSMIYKEVNEYWLIEYSSISFNKLKIQFCWLYSMVWETPRSFSLSKFLLYFDTRRASWFYTMVKILELLWIKILIHFSQVVIHIEHLFEFIGARFKRMRSYYFGINIRSIKSWLT